MNFRLLIAGALTLFSLQSTAQLSSGMVAHWPFNGTTGDSSGNTHHGTGIFLHYGTGRNGISGTAAVFNGSSSYVSVPYQSDLNLTSYSICAIIKPTGYYSGLCQTNAILWRGLQYTSSNYGLYYFDNPYDNDCNIQDTSKNVFAAFAGNNGGSATQWQYSPNIVSNNWYAVVATYTNDTVKIYVNGQLKSKVLATTPLGTSTDGLFIGANFQNTTGTYPYWLNAFVDDLRLYNRVLTNDEIRHYSYGLYFTPTPPTSVCKNVTYAIPFSTVNDYSSGNTFTLQLSDATGSFASPTVVGTTSATSSTTIPCTVPSSITSGSGYKMRIISSNPFTVSDSISVSIGIPATPPTVYSTVAPNNKIPSGTNTFFTSVATNAGASPTYQWKKNGVAIAGATGITYSAKAGTDYSHLDTITVTIRSSVFCATPDSVNSTPITMYLTNVGVENIASANDLHVFPNPASGSISISSPMLKNNDVMIEISSVTGQKVLTRNIKNNQEGILKLELSDYRPGLYYIKVTDNSTSLSVPVLLK